MQWFGLALVCSAIAFTNAGAASDVCIRLLHDASGKPSSFEVLGLSANELKTIGERNRTPEQWVETFAVRPVQRRAEPVGPAMLGSYRIATDAIRFEPKFPLVPGVSYLVMFKSAKPQAAVVETTITIPLPVTTPTLVEQIYPSADVLPENQLRFYIHFSAPMRQGDVYRHIRLLDSTGKPIEQALLELEDELWDREGKRFTLLFHPGRVKKGLEPRERLGPILESGKTYTLVIDREWLDANGKMLKASFQKRFKAGPAEETSPDPKTWKISSPLAESKQPVVVQFPQPLDHALLNRLIWVVDADGQKVDGDVAIGSGEARWLFTPKRDWQAGAYRLVVDTRLEDRAGNSIARPFEVDVFHPIENEIKAETVTVPFQITER